MTAMIFAPGAGLASKLHELARALGEAVDAFAAYRIQRAVPEAAQLQAAREIEQYRAQMRTQANARS